MRGAFDHVFSGELPAFPVVGAWRGLALASRSASVVGCYLGGERSDVGVSHSHRAKLGYQRITNRSAGLFELADLLKRSSSSGAPFRGIALARGFGLLITSTRRLQQFFRNSTAKESRLLRSAFELIQSSAATSRARCELVLIAPAWIMDYAILRRRTR